MLAFDAATHCYTWNGRRVQNVTGVLPKPPGLMYANAYDVERKLLLGRCVHRAIQLDLHGSLDETTLDDEVRPYLVVSWREFCDVTGFEPLLVELPLYADDHDYAGTLDVAGYMRARRTQRERDALCLIDLKCTAIEPPPATGPQTAAYEHLIVRNFPRLRVRERYALRLCPDERPPYRLIPYRDQNDFGTFLSFLRVARWCAAHGLD